MPTDEQEHWQVTYSGPPAPLEPVIGSHRVTRSFSIVTAIIAVNVGIYLIQGALSKTAPPSTVAPYVVAQDAYGRLVFPPPADALYWWGALQTVAVVAGRQYWRLITAQYLHASFLHIAFNMLALHFLGRPLERMWSARKFLAVYTVCGLAGNIFFAVLGAKGVIDPRQPAVGASGSIYGLLGIVAVLFPAADVLIYFVLRMKIRTAAIALGAIAFMSVVERGSNYGGEACHLAGLAFGVWWAMQGDEWWSNSEWALPWSKRKPPPRGA